MILSVGNANMHFKSTLPDYTDTLGPYFHTVYHGVVFGDKFNKRVW